MHDLRITNGMIMDGRGAPGRPGELAIRQGRIVAMGTTVSGAARTTIDALGHVICPGFIDLHTHCEAGLNENFLQSGVTLVVGGNCGFSSLDMAGVAAGCPGACGPNLAMLVGHNNVRMKVMGNVDRHPSAAELEQMRALILQAMSDGAAGFSTGLTYVPGHYADTKEIIELARAAASHGGYYASHMRDEGDGLLDSIRETAEIGMAVGLPVHVSHIKACGMKNWGRSKEALRLLDELSAKGLDITQDQYPYSANCAQILWLFPAWAQEGGVDDLRARLADKAPRSRVKEALITRLVEYFGGNGERVVIPGGPGVSLAGCSLAARASSLGRSTAPEDLAETLLDVVVCPSMTDVFCVFHSMSEDDVSAFMRHPRTAVGSDAWALPITDKGRPHPRLFGTCSRVLGHYARELGLFPMEEAVRRMSGLPASRMGLDDRGTLHEGAWADLVIFDPKIVADRATFENPCQYPQGIDYVVVNGQITLDHGQHTGALPGVFVPRPVRQA